MKISVVTVVYENLTGLRLTAASISSQSHDDIEWIIVDGGSVDGTAEFVATLGRVVAVFISEKDRGIYDAMNKGVLLATGEYVILMNGGDCFAGEESVSMIARTAIDACYPDLVFGSSYLIFPSGVRIARTVKNPNSYICHGLPALHQAIAFRRATHLRFLYDLKFKVASDYATVAAIMADRGRWVCLKDPVSLNAVAGSSYSHNNRRDLYRDPWLVQRDILNLPLSRRVLSNVRRRVATWVFDLLSDPALSAFWRHLDR